MRGLPLIDGHFSKLCFPFCSSEFFLTVVRGIYGLSALLRTVGERDGLLGKHESKDKSRAGKNSC